MYNANQLMAGHFYEAEYYEHTPNTKGYVEPAITFRYRPYNQSAGGISVESENQLLTQDIIGYTSQNHSLIIETVSSIKFKPNDKVKLVGEDKWFIIQQVVIGRDSINAINNLQFKSMMSNKPKVLYLK